MQAWHAARLVVWRGSSRCYPVSLCIHTFNITAYMDLFGAGLFFMAYVLPFIVALRLSLRPAPLAVAALITLLITALPLAILDTKGAGGDRGLDITLVLFILVVAYTGLGAGFVTRLVLWFFLPSSSARSHQLRRGVVMLTGVMFLPGLVLAFI